MNEADYTQELKKRFELEGWRTHKTSERFTSGWPDLLALKDGRVLFIEVKMFGNTLSALQEKTLHDIASAKCEACVLWADRKRERPERIMRVTPASKRGPDLNYEEVPFPVRPLNELKSKRKVK